MVAVTELLGLKLFFTARKLEEVPALDEEFHGGKSEIKELSRPSVSLKYEFIPQTRTWSTFYRRKKEIARLLLC